MDGIYENWFCREIVIFVMYKELNQCHLHWPVIQLLLTVTMDGRLCHVVPPPAT